MQKWMQSLLKRRITIWTTSKSARPKLWVKQHPLMFRWGCCCNQQDNPLMKKHQQDCPKEKHLSLNGITNASICSNLGSLPQMKQNWIQTSWTQGIQSANIYPNLIALSALIEKKDARVRVDMSWFALKKARKWKSCYRGGCKIVAKCCPILLAFKVRSWDQRCMCAKSSWEGKT